jgi:hypothetical protein
LEVPLQEKGLLNLFVLFLLVLIDGVLVEIVLGIEVTPHEESEHHCLLNPAQEGIPDVAGADIGM